MYCVFIPTALADAPERAGEYTDPAVAHLSCSYTAMYKIVPGMICASPDRVPSQNPRIPWVLYTSSVSEKRFTLDPACSL